MSTIITKLSIATAGAALTAMSLAVATPVKAALISFSPQEQVPSLVVSPAFGQLAPGGEVGTAFINKGVDFSFGGREGIFDDGGNTLAFGGVGNITDEVDLYSPVDGRIVTPGTLSNGLTSFISIEAGYAEPGQLLLEIFNNSGALLASVANGLPLGPNGRTTLTIDRNGIFDIGSFRVSTPVNDSFGVNFVQLETPINAGSVQPEPVPEPLTILGSGVALGFGSLMKRQQSRKLKKTSVAE